MTGIEQLITDTLTALDQELRQEQKIQGEILATQQKSMVMHTNILHQLQQQIALLSAQQQKSTMQLKRLSAIHENLKPLLVYLNDILSNTPKV